MNTRSMLVGVAAVAAVAALGVASVGHDGAAPVPVAQAATPDCGGQGAANFVGPGGYVCQNTGSVQGVGYTLNVNVHSDRTFTLTFTLSKRIGVKVGLQARAHPHLSGDPGVTESFTTLPAGELSTTWGGQFPAGNLCDPHQFDIKAQPGVEGGPGHWDKKWRISGATFVFATPEMGCGVSPTTTAAPTTIPATTVPGQTTTTASVSVATVAPGAIPATR